MLCHKTEKKPLVIILTLFCITDTKCLLQVYTQSPFVFCLPLCSKSNKRKWNLWDSSEKLVLPRSESSLCSDYKDRSSHFFSAGKTTGLLLTFSIDNTHFDAYPPTQITNSQGKDTGSHTYYRDCQMASWEM